MKELSKVLVEIQDYLVPILDTYEQAIYHFLFRNSYLEGKRDSYFKTRSSDIGFGQGDIRSKPSDRQKSKKLKSLESKKAIKIIERSHKGILVHLYLPSEIDGLIPSESSEEFDLEKIDFFKDRKFLPVLLERENYRCFYTGKKINSNNCYLDHVIPQANDGNNSYRNIVASSYDANSLKSDKSIDDFIRLLYKEELISLNEFNNLKIKVKKLQDGELVPNKELVVKIIKGN